MFPKNIQIETTTCCPGKCIMCPRAFVSRPPLMPMPLIEKIINECEGKDVTIIPHQMGDPLADKRMFDILKTCKDRKLRILMSTSGIFLDKETSRKLTDLGIDIVNISLDSLDKKIYEKIRGISFQKVMDNIKGLLSVKRPPLEVWVSAVDIFFNKKTRTRFIDYWKNRADRVQITPYVRYPKVKNWRLPRKKMKNSNFCERLENDMVILTNGEVSKCCVDFEGATSFGNINTESLSEIWNGKKRKAFMESLRTGGRKKLYPCNICVI